MLTDTDKRDIEKQTGVALDKDQKGFFDSTIRNFNKIYF